MIGHIKRPEKLKQTKKNQYIITYINYIFLNTIRSESFFFYQFH